MARILTITLNPALDLTVRLRQLELGAVNRSEAVLTQAAGKGLNVAQVLADLGHRLTVSGFLGEDNQPPFTAMFQRRGFADAFVRVPGETRSNIKLAERGGRVSDLNGPGPEADERAQAALLERLDRLAGEHELAVVAGSLPRGVAPEWLGELLRRLRRLGLKVAFDSSGAALREGVKAAPWMIKPNVEELADLCSAPMDDLVAQRQAAERLRHDGVGQVVISQGAAGGQLVRRRGCLAGAAAGGGSGQHGGRRRFPAGRHAARAGQRLAGRAGAASGHRHRQPGGDPVRVRHRRSAAPGADRSGRRGTAIGRGGLR